MSRRVERIMVEGPGNLSPTPLSEPRESTMSKGSILVVDDEKLIRWSLTEFFQQMGYDVQSAEDWTGVTDSLDGRQFDVILLDFKLPEVDGIEILERIRQTDQEVSVIMITAHSNIDHVVTAIKAGANDYIAKPFRNEDIQLRVEKVLETRRLRREVSELREEQGRGFRFDNVVGNSAAMRETLEFVRRVIQSGDPTILIQGESGTGKDLLAKVMHFGGGRASGAFITVTCTALPQALMESELFGHEKGAFTDAKELKKGLIEISDGGTLFLDEIGDMDLYLQSKLLRFLEEKTFRRVGGQDEIRVSVQIIAATNRNLKKLVEEGKFREDLYFRLMVIPVDLPPLRERAEDVPLLVEHFVQTYNVEFNKKVRGVTTTLMKRLCEYPWYGNVRELRNAIERAMILCTDEFIGEDSLALDLVEAPGHDGEPGTTLLKLPRAGLDLEELEKDLIRQALRHTGGNQTRAGALLGLNRDQVRYRVEKYKLEIPGQA